VVPAKDSYLDNSMRSSVSFDLTTEKKNVSMIEVRKIIGSAFPFRMTIVSVTTTDLKSIHLLRKNSPHVNVACGLWASSTSVISRE
jgi:hypothetical protein